MTSCKLSQFTTSALIDATHKTQTKLLLRISAFLFTQRHSGLSVITQFFIFPSTQCHSLSHSPLPSHPHSVTLYDHTILQLPIHTVSLSAITVLHIKKSIPTVSLSVVTQSLSSQSHCFTLSSHSPLSFHSHRFTLSSHSPSSSHSHRFTLCHHTVLHLPIHTVSFSVIKYIYIPIHTMSLSVITVLHLPIHKVSLSVITQSFIFPFTQCDCH